MLAVRITLDTNLLYIQQSSVLFAEPTESSMFMKKWRFLAAIDTCDIGHEHLKTSKLQLIFV